MKLLQCSCKVAQLTRMKRPIWLRLIPFMRLCYCRGCKQKVFTARNCQWLPYFVYTYYRRRSAAPGWDHTIPMYYDPIDFAWRRTRIARHSCAACGRR
jgi:hypothetical protein